MGEWELGQQVQNSGQGHSGHDSGLDRGRPGLDVNGSSRSVGVKPQGSRQDTGKQGRREGKQEPARAGDPKGRLGQGKNDKNWLGPGQSSKQASKG